MPRDPVAGPDSPVSPFPLPLSGTVTKGFGRGSKDLGIPTGKQFALKEETYQCVLLTKKPIANLPESVAQSAGEVLESGIYYGWASVGSSDPTVRPMVMSFGWNPFYKNERRSAVILAPVLCADKISHVCVPMMPDTGSAHNSYL